jgi:hypothetical protein
MKYFPDPSHGCLDVGRKSQVRDIRGRVLLAILQRRGSLSRHRETHHLGKMFSKLSETLIPTLTFPKIQKKEKVNHAPEQS